MSFIQPVTAASNSCMCEGNSPMGVRLRKFRTQTNYFAGVIGGRSVLCFANERIP